MYSFNTIKSYGTQQILYKWITFRYNSANCSHASITSDELEKVLKLTKNGKAPGQDNINSQLYKHAPVEFKLRLLQFLNNIEKIAFQMSREMLLLPPYLRKVTEENPKTTEEYVFSIQNEFRKGMSCTDPTFCLKLLIEKRREMNLETHLLFIDYEKAFDNIQRQI